MPSVASLTDHLRATLAGTAAMPVSTLELTSIGGGSINQAWRLLVNGRDRFFCKTNDAARFPALFEKRKTALPCWPHRASSIFRK